MPTQSKHQSMLQRLRRLNERMPVDYYGSYLIKAKCPDNPDEPDVIPEQLYTYHFTEHKAINRHQRFMRRARQCKRFRPIIPI